MEKARFDLLFWLYSAGQTLAAPVLLLKKWRRFRARGDAYEWDLKRWICNFESQNSDSTKNVGNALAGPHLVLVAMGFAETRLAARLTELLRVARPELRVTWAIRNLEAARQGGAIPTKNEGQNLAPFPFDHFLAVRLWRKRVRPDAVVFIERFAFPLLARELHNHGVRVGAVAARSRGGGNSVYRRWLLQAFDLLALRSHSEREKLGPVSDSTRVLVTGTLKFWPQLPPLEPQKMSELMRWLSQNPNRPLLAAGSTQPGDETWIFEAFAPLREQFGAQLLLAPRQSERAGEVEALCAARGWTVSRRSQSLKPIPQKMTGEATSNPCDVLLLDTLGELTHAYGACLAAFVGGTISGTGHNVLEPVAHGIPVFFGPKPGTFAAEQEMCESAGAGFRVQTPAELSRGFERAILDPKWRAEIAEKARELNAHGALARDASVAAILEMLDETP